MKCTQKIFAAGSFTKPHSVFFICIARTYYIGTSNLTIYYVEVAVILRSLTQASQPSSPLNKASGRPAAVPSTGLVQKSYSGRNIRWKQMFGLSGAQRMNLLQASHYLTTLREIRNSLIIFRTSLYHLYQVQDGAHFSKTSLISALKKMLISD